MATKRSQTAKDVKKSVNEAVNTVDEQTQKAGEMVRRAVLAYLGLYGVAYDEAQTRVKAFRENRKDWFDRLVVKGEEMEVQAGELLEDAQERIEENTAKLREALGRDNVVELKVKTKPAAKKKPVAKKTTAKKKPAAKKAAAKKKTVAKATVKVTAKKAPAKKAAPKATKKTVTSVAGTEVKPETADKYADYLTDIQRYDTKATKAVVKKIVDHCGIALDSQDGMFVACSDETERNTVRDSWLKKKLGIEGTDEMLDVKVEKVCDQMKDDHMKKRVTFYYLVAKNDGALIFI